MPYIYMGLVVSVQEPDCACIIYAEEHMVHSCHIGLSTLSPKATE